MSRHIPSRQDSGVSTTSSGGRTVRANSNGRTRRSSLSNGGPFKSAAARDTDDDLDLSDAGPSDWYRRSPSPTPPHSPPLAWRQPASPTSYDFDDGPHDIWRASASASLRSASPTNDDKEFFNRLDSLAHDEAQDEPDEKRHPADITVEEAGNTGAGDGADVVNGDDGPESEIGSQVLSPSGSSMSLGQRPFLLSKPGLPAISRLRSHHRSVSSTTQQSFRLHHSRTPSQFSQLSAASEPPAPAEPAFSFHPLRSLSSELFKQHRPTTMDVRGMIAVGTESGTVVIYTFAQELRHTLPSTSGPVTAVRISADFTYVAVGHTSGDIHLWELRSPSKPARSTLALSAAQLKSGRKDGHLQGDAIQHIGFVAARHTAVVSADASGRAFWWSLGRVMGVDSNDVIRILGGPKQSQLLSAGPLPLGETKHSTDETQISALLTPRKLVVIGLKPSAKTLHRRVGRGSHGCTAWLRAGQLGEGSDPVLAYSWDEHLHFLRVPAFVEGKPYVASGPILALEWFEQNHILLTTRTELILLDVRSNQAVESVPFQSHLAQSISVYRGKVFILTKTSIQAGTLMYWNDKILARVHRGDFLGAIHQAVAYYSRTAGGNHINLPDSSTIATRILDLVKASLNWAFSEDRMRDDTHYSADGRGVDLTSRFENLAQSCIEACTAIDAPLDEAYEHYERAGIQNIFLSKLAPSNRLTPPLAKALIEMHIERGAYKMAEEVIWSARPDVLDINQVVTVCEDHQLWDALIHVYTRALHDFVTPIGKLLGPRVEPARVYQYLEDVLVNLPNPQIYDAILGDYLSHLLEHPEAFLHVLDLAFEESYLNDAPTSRQTIINVLLDKAPKDTFVQIFVARNLPKYPQFIILPPTTLHRILVQLCSNVDTETADDRQLAVEYLLSAYNPHDLDQILHLFEKAGFYRLLGRYYRRDRKWIQLAQTIMRDPDSNPLEDLQEIIPLDIGVLEVVQINLEQLLDLDIAGTAQLMARWLPDRHSVALQHLHPLRQMIYLRSLPVTSLDRKQKHLYISLLRQHEPGQVLIYLEQAQDLDLPRLVSEFEQDGYVEGQLWALNQLGDATTFEIAGHAIRAFGFGADDRLNATVLMAAKLAKAEDDWYNVLQPLVEVSQVHPTSQLRGLIQHTLAALIASKIAFPPLFKRLVDATDAGRGYAELRSMVTGMLESYQSEGAVLTTTVRLMQSDLFPLVQELTGARQRGWRQAL